MTGREVRQGTQIDFKQKNRFLDIVSFGYIRVQLADYPHPLLVQDYRCLPRRVQASVVARLEAGVHSQPVQHPFHNSFGVVEVQPAVVALPARFPSLLAQYPADGFRFFRQVARSRKVYLALFEEPYPAVLMSPVGRQCGQQVDPQVGAQVFLFHGHRVYQPERSWRRRRFGRVQFLHHFQAVQRIGDYLLETVTGQALPGLSLQAQDGCRVVLGY